MRIARRNANRLAGLHGEANRHPSAIPIRNARIARRVGDRSLIYARTRAQSPTVVRLIFDTDRAEPGILPIGGRDVVRLRRVLRDDAQLTEATPIRPVRLRKRSPPFRDTE